MSPLLNKCYCSDLLRGCKNKANEVDGPNEANLANKANEADKANEAGKAIVANEAHEANETLELMRLPMKSTGSLCPMRPM